MCSQKTDLLNFLCQVLQRCSDTCSNTTLTSTMYGTGPVGAPITFHDVLYGWGVQVSRGNIFYAHKTGFTALSLSKSLVDAEFGSVFVGEQGGNLHAIAYKKEGVSCP